MFTQSIRNNLSPDPLRNIGRLTKSLFLQQKGLVNTTGLDRRLMSQDSHAVAASQTLCSIRVASSIPAHSIRPCSLPNPPDVCSLERREASAAAKYLEMG